MAELLLLPFKIVFWAFKLVIGLALFALCLLLLPFVLLAGAIVLLKCIF